MDKGMEISENFIRKPETEKDNYSDERERPPWMTPETCLSESTTKKPHVFVLDTKQGLGLLCDARRSTHLRGPA